MRKERKKVKVNRFHGLNTRNIYSLILDPAPRSRSSGLLPAPPGSSRLLTAIYGSSQLAPMAARSIPPDRPFPSMMAPPKQ